MSKLDEWVTIHFKENSIPGLRSGELTDESKLQIKILMLEIFAKAIKADSIKEMGEVFRKEIEEL